MWLWFTLLFVFCGALEDPLTLWQREKDTQYSLNSLDEWGHVKHPQSNVDVKYLVLASNTVRPGQIFRVHVHLVHCTSALHLRASLSCDGSEVAAGLEEVEPGDSVMILLQVPKSAKNGKYSFRVQGNPNGVLGGTAFLEEREVFFKPQFLTILIQSSQLVYNFEQKISARVVLLTTELKPYDDPVDVFLIDSRGLVMKRWSSRYPYLGIISVSFDLPEDYATGWWTIRAQVLDQIEEKTILLEKWYSERYDVYVAMPPFVVATDGYLEGDISANFTNVAPTYGNLTIRAIVKPLHNSPHHQIPLVDNFVEDYIHDFHGAHHFQYSLQSLQSLVSPYPLHGCEVEVHASVGERFLEITVDGYSRTRIINDSISVKILGDKPLVFKPEMEFYIYIQVSYFDLVKLPEEKLENANVTVTMVTAGLSGRYEFHKTDHALDSSGIARVKETAPDKAERIYVRAEFHVDYNTLAYAEETLVAFHRTDNRFMQVTTSTYDGVAGEYAVLHVRTNFYIEYFHYLTISKGNVLQTGKIAANGMHHTITSFALPLSPEMAPSLKVVVYHSDSKDYEVISDSVTIPVRGINRGDLRVWVNTQQDRTGDLVEVVADYTTEALVSTTSLDTDLIAVQGRNDITPAEVARALHRMETNGSKLIGSVSRDREGGPDELIFFATLNAAADSNKTFIYAGLVLFTNLNLTQSLYDVCNGTGRLPCKTGNSCFMRRERCDGYRHCEDGTDESDCIDILASDKSLFDFHLYRRNRFNNFFDATGSMFGYKDIYMGNLRQIFTKTDVPKAPTLYHINAIAVSKQYGFQVLQKPILHDSTRPFFMTTEAPTEAVYGEQIGIRVVLFNYQHFEIQAELILHDSEDYRFVHVQPFGIVSSYNPKTSNGEHQHVVFIKAWQHIIIHLPIVSTRVGEVTVKITGRTQVGREEADITINFLPDGVPLQLHLAMMFDMRTISKNLKFFDFNITDTPIIPFIDEYRRYIFDSPSARISIIGDVVGASSVDIPVPMGEFGFATGVQSGEHTLFDFGYHLAVLHYLRLTNQMTSETSNKLFEHLNKVYVDQTGYFKNGGFTMYKDEGSVWLTALAAKIYHDAIFPDWEYKHLYIDTSIIKKSVRFLLRHQDMSLGCFYENYLVPHNRRMRSFTFNDNRVLQNFRNATITAHVLITLAKVSDLVTGSMRGELSVAKKAAMQYLEGYMPYMRNSSYHLAITTYALMLAGSTQAEPGYGMLTKMMKEREGMLYWSSVEIGPATIVYETQRPFYYANLPAEDDALGVETTSYVLLVMMEYGAPGQDMVVKWLNWMRYTDFGFVGAQDTLIAMEALTKYSFRTHVRDITDLKIAVDSSANPGHTHYLTVSKNNLAERKFVKMAPKVFGHAEVMAEGAGLAVVQMDITYNVDHEFLLVPPAQNAFDLTIEMMYTGRNKSHMEIRTCSKWLLTKVANYSGASIVEVIIPTGYSHYRPVIDNYVRMGYQPRLKRAFIAPRSAAFMLDTIPADEWTCFQFGIQRWYPVANVTRYLKVKVYEYDAPENYKEKMFEDADLYYLNICEVCGSYQCPYCPYFSGATFPQLSRVITLLIFSFLCMLHPRVMFFNI